MQATMQTNLNAPTQRPAPSRFLGPEYDLPSFPEEPRRNYIVCSSPRCGSSLLCRLLEHTGHMGAPFEYLNHEVHVQPLAQRLGVVSNGRVDPGSYLRAVQRIRTSPNGVFGLKTHYSHLAAIIRIPGISAFVASSSFIWIRRRDILSQAISLLKASQTGQWGLSEGDVTLNNVLYSYEGITKALAIVQRENAGWEKFFCCTELPNLQVWYEDLVSETNAVCQAAYRLVLGQDWPGHFSLEQSKRIRQADSANSEWKTRFIAQTRTEYGLP
jgi:trehalose 2-sulfotransferase